MDVPAAIAIRCHTCDMESHGRELPPRFFADGSSCPTARGSPLLPGVAEPSHGASRRPLEFDVSIVGAGPAGAAAALELAARGVHVGLIEKAIPPRYKTCGGGVLRRALKLLPIDVSAAIERECYAAEIVHHAPDLRFVSERPQ